MSRNRPHYIGKAGGIQGNLLKFYKTHFPHSLLLFLLQKFLASWVDLLAFSFVTVLGQEKIQLIFSHLYIFTANYDIIKIHGTG